MWKAESNGLYELWVGGCHCPQELFDNVIIVHKLSNSRTHVAELSFVSLDSH